MSANPRGRTSSNRSAADLAPTALRRCCVALLCLAWPYAASALTYTNASQGFETNAPDYWSNVVINTTYFNKTNDTSAWIVNNAMFRAGAGWTNSGVLGIRLPQEDGSNAWVRTPVLTNGIGTITLYARNHNTAGKTNLLNIETSSDGFATWVTNGVFTITGNADQLVGLTNSASLYGGTNLALRFRKVTTNTGPAHLVLDDIAISAPPAQVSLSNLVSSPAQPLDMSPVTISITPVVQGFLNSLTVTNYWREWPGTNWTSIAMASNSFGVFTNTSSIPGRPIGAVVEYRASAAYDWDTGPLYTNSVTNSYVVRPWANSGSLSITGAVTTNLFLAGNYQWQRAVAVSNLTDAAFRFAGVSNTATTLWGDANQSVSNVPVFGSAEVSATNIIMAGVNTGNLLFSFNESNLSYKVQPCAYVNFDSWPDTAFGSVFTNSGWVLSDGQVTNDPARAFVGRAAALNGSAATNAFLQSPYLSNGVGTISFWYRNWDGSGKTGGTLRVQVATSLVASAWTTVSTLTNIISTNYLCATIARYDTASRYIRLLNDTNVNHAILCVDEVAIADPGAGVVLSGLTNTPAVPTWTDAVQVAVTTATAGGAFGLQCALYYRGATGWTNAPAMTNSGSTFYGTIPAGVGQTNQAGTVLYYVSCAFQGLDSELTSPTITGTNSYVIPRSLVTITNIVTVPDRPLIGSNTVISAQVLPFYAVSNAVVTAYYRVGAGGAVQSNAMTATGASNTYTVSNIVFQAAPGVPIYYWINAAFAGGDPVSPTNSATNVVYLKPRQVTSDYSGMVLSGSLTNALILTSNGTWQGVVTMSGSVDPTFRFAGISGVTTTYWGVASQTISNYPYYGTAESNAGPIMLYGTNTGYVVFDFNEATGVYVIRRCAYVNFDSWSNAPAFGAAYTNADGWILNDGRTTTNAVNEAGWIFGGGGRSGFLNQDTGTNAYLMSPYLADGVGQISFWYRNWETNVSRTNTFYVQVAATNTASANWTTVAVFTNVLSQDYLYFAADRADLTSHGVRILNSTNSPHAILCLDEVVVSDAGANVLYSGLTNNPGNPTILSSVNIEVDVNPRAGAIVTNMICWFRASSDGVFETIPMAANGGPNHYVTTAGITNVDYAEYAVQCFFSGFQSDRTSPLFFPPGGTNTPQTFGAVTPPGVYRTQGFETNAPDYWSNVVVSTTYFNKTNDTSGWIVNSAIFLSANSTNSGVLGIRLPQDDGSNAWVRTPVLTHGIGTITLYARNHNTEGKTNLLNIETSSDGFATWVTNGVFTITGNANQLVGFTNSANLYGGTNLALRFRKVTTNTGPAHLVLDDITIHYPAARVAITNVFLNPGYPTTSDTVRVSCDVYSVSPLFPAYAIRPTLWYRAAAGTWTSLPMGRTSPTGNTYTNSIPPFNPIRDGKVEYCIRCDFTGYRSGSSGDGTSPAFSPAGGTNAPFNYITRAASSSYSNITATVNGQASPARMLSSNTWQVVVSPSASTNSMTISWSGYGYSTGTGWSAESANWGLSNGWQTAVPMADYAFQGQSAITVTGSFSSASSYLIRFNEQTGEYLVVPCVSQNFDNSGDDTSGTYRQKNLSNTGRGSSVNFDSWPANQTAFRFEDFSFSQWTNLVTSSNVAAFGGQSYVTYGCLYTNAGGSALRSKSSVTDIDQSFVALGANWDPSTNRLRGIGAISWMARSVTTNDPLKISIYLMNTSDAVAEDDFYKTAQWSPNLVATWTNGATTSFVSNTFNLNTSTTYHVIFSATQNMIMTSFNVGEWYATSNAVDQWTSSQSWIQTGGTTRGGSATNECLFDTTRATNELMWLQSPPITGGVATIDLDYRSASQVLGSFAIQMSTSTPPVWTGTPLTNVFFSRNGPYISLPAGFANLSGGMTLSAWALPSAGNNRGARFFDLSGAGLGNSILFGIGETNALVYSVWTNGTGLSPVSSPANVVYTNRPDFHHYVATETAGGTVRLFRDGQQVASGTTYAVPNIQRTANYIGKSPWVSDASYAGFLDELRVSTVARSTNWIEAEYNTMVSSAFYTNGPVTRDWVTGTKTGYQMQVTFSGYTRGEVLTNFPALIQFYNGMPTGSNTFSFAGTPFLNNGYDLRFGATSNWSDTNLNYEIDVWNTAVRGQVWVQVPVLSNSASIWAKWGNSANNQQMPFTTNGATWSDGYAAVWHMDTPNSVDAARKGYDGTAHGNTTLTGGGQVGSCQQFPDTYSEYSHLTYVLVSGVSPLYFRIYPTRTQYSNQMSYSTAYLVQSNLASMAIDYVNIGGFASPSDWFVNNGLIKYNDISYPPAARQFYKGALYFNSNNVSEIYTGDPLLTPLTNLVSYIRTPSVPGGIGEIGFWYRNWATSSPARPAQLLIQRSPTGGTNASEWSTLAAPTLASVTNTADYAYFSTSVYDTSNLFVRVVNAASDSPTGMARVCIDDLVVTAPLATSLSLSNLVVSPVIPLSTDRVDVVADIYHMFYNPTNPVLTAFYGVTSNYAGLSSLVPTQQLTMTCIASNTTVPGKWYRYKTSTPIPTNAADTFVKYYVRATYDGYFTSPQTNRLSAITPTWYSPLVYSATNPYYIVFSCPTGSVWFNEINYYDVDSSYTKEYIELCGKKNSDIRNWRLSIYNYAGLLTNGIVITNHTTIPNTTNSFGFWVLGDSGVPNVDMVFTGKVTEWDPEQNLPDGGGLRLFRGCGAMEQEIAYGGGASGFPSPVGYDYYYYDNGSLSLTGSGSNYASFAWAEVATRTPGTVNTSQILMGQSTQNAPPPSVTNIVAFWIDTNVWIECTGTNSWVPTPWYTTNLLDTNGWTGVTPFYSTYPTLSASNTFTVHFDLPTNQPSYFYRIVHTNGQ